MPVKPVSNIAKSASDKPDVISSGNVASPAVDFSQINKRCAPFILRLQTNADAEWVEKLHGQCFGPGRFTRSAFIVRETVGLAPDLCLIAEIGGQRVGSVWMSPIALNKVPGFLLGPLAIAPQRRNQGIGGHLVKTVTAMALEKLSDGFVLLVGDAPYYRPFGYRLAGNGGIMFPGPVDPERVLVCRNRSDHAKELSGNIVGR